MKADRQQEILEILRSRKIVPSTDGVIYHARLDRPLASFINNKGYICHKLFGKTVLAHQIIWLAFKGPYAPNLQINHKDHNKQNNHLLNLELVSGKQNVCEAIKLAKGPSHLTEQNVFDIRTKIKNKMSRHAICTEFAISDQVYWNIKACRTFKEFLP